MSDLVFTLVREPTIRVPGGESYTPGIMYANGLRFCFTCEDEDRFLEKQGTLKVQGKTAIPRGKYELDMSMSNHFKRMLPEVKNVPQYLGVRCHGGNKAEDSEGCVLLGLVRTSTGIADCASTVLKMIAMISQCINSNGKCYLEIK